SPQRQTFHCFGCGVGGSVFRFVMDYEHVDFPAAVHKLAARVGITIVEERRREDEMQQHEARRLLLRLHAEAAEWFHENLLERGEGEFYDRFRGRIMFPICNDVGEVIAFSGRILANDATAAEYINSPETPLFRKGRILFGLHKTKRALIEADCAIVCEGQLDL